MFFSQNLLVKITRSSLLSFGTSSNTPSLSYFRSLSAFQSLSKFNSQDFFFFLVLKDLDCLSFPQDIIRVHYIDGMMLTEPTKQSPATILDLLVSHLQIRFANQRVGNKSNKNSEAIYPSEISRGPVV